MIESLNQIITKIEQLSEWQQEKIVQIILKELEHLTTLSTKKKQKLSETLLLPAL